MLNEVIKGISMALNTAFGDEYEILQNDVEQGLAVSYTHLTLPTT